MAPVTLAAAALLPLLAASPRAPELVDVARAIPDATIDLRYASARHAPTGLRRGASA